MLAIVGLASFGIAGPGEVIEISDRQAKRPWIWSPHDGSAIKWAYDLRDRILVVTDRSLVDLDPVTGRARWTAPLPKIPDAASYTPTRPFANGQTVVVALQVRARNSYLQIATFASRSGKRLGDFRIETEYEVPPRIDDREIRVWSRTLALRFDHQGKRLPNGSAFPFSHPGSFSWRGYTVAYTENEDFAMDYGTANGLRGIQLLDTASQDLWKGTLMRRQLRGGTTELAGKMAFDLFGPPICADRNGVWTTHFVGTRKQLVRILPNGTLDRSIPQPYVEGTPRWTNRGIWFVRDGRMWQFDGQRMIGVGRLPDAASLWNGWVSRHGFLSIVPSTRNDRYVGILRLHPMH